MSEYRRGLDWRFYFLTIYTLMTRDFALLITDTHRDYCRQSNKIFICRFLATDFNTGTMTVSLNYTLQI
jgi:hypothetical protein